MDNDRELITAEMLDRMSPDERASTVNRRIITDLDQLPAGFRDDVIRTATRLSDELRLTDDR